MIPNEKDTDEMLNANNAGQIVGVSGKTMIRLMTSGAVPGYRIGGVWKFKRGEVEYYRDSQRYQLGRKEGDLPDWDEVKYLPGEA